MENGTEEIALQPISLASKEDVNELQQADEKNDGTLNYTSTDVDDQQNRELSRTSNFQFVDEEFQNDSLGFFLLSLF